MGGEGRFAQTVRHAMTATASDPEPVEAAHVDTPRSSTRVLGVSMPWRRTGGSGRIRRVPHLDLLRAFAILLVIGRHLELPRPDGPVGVFADWWYRVGWMGVDLFFVLSGFLIAGLLINESSTGPRLDIRRFLFRRGMKIYPLYFLFVGYIILSPVARAVLNGGDAGATLSDQLSLHWPNLVFVQNYVGDGSIGHLWSIAIEEHFYLLLPIVVAVLGYRRSRVLVWIGFGGVFLFLALRVLSVATDDPFAAGVSATHLRLDGLLFGVALRAALEYYPDRFAALRRWRVPLLFLGVMLWIPCMVVPVDSAFTRTVGLTFTLLGAAAILVALYHSSADDLGITQPLARPIVRGLCWIGVFSYAIYLWHVTVLGGLTKVTDRTISNWFGEGQLGWLLSTAFLVTGVIAVGVAATLLVERPLLHLRDRYAPSRAPALPTDRAASIDEEPEPSLGPAAPAIVPQPAVQPAD